MTIQAKALVAAVGAGAVVSLYSTHGHPAQQWLHFFVYLAAILLSSGMKVAMPKSNGTMSVNFPFILLGILELSPLQAVALAACSVFAQCRIRVIRPFTLIQILFNVTNVITATVLAWYTYAAFKPHAEVAPALAVAAMVYFVANTIPVVLVISWESKAAPFKKWREEYLWYFPFYLVGAVLAAFTNFISNKFGWTTSLLLIPLVYIIYRAYCAQMAIVRDRERHITEIEALQLRTIEGFAMAIEAKDQGTHRHLMRVRVYASELGKIMGLDQSVMKALVTASFLHDIGKLAVPEHIINKPGKLTPDEFEKMKIHPVVGADILVRVQFPYPVVPIVRSHHEAWDGSGYPDGLKAEEIPIGARILSVVDCFDALASDRPYRSALPLDQAMAHMRAKAGIQFDPEIVRLLEEHYPRLEELACEQIEDVAPLNTDIFIANGVAPRAGFEPEQGAQVFLDIVESERTKSSGAIAVRPHSELRRPIVAADQEAKAILELSQMLDGLLNARATISSMFERLQPLIPFDCLAVYLKSEGSILTPYLEGPCAEAFSARSISIGEGLSGWVAENRRPIVNGNPTVEPNFRAESGLFTRSSSALSAPLVDAGGAMYAVLTVYSREHAAFSRDHLRILEAIGSRYSVSLQNEIRVDAAETETKGRRSMVKELAWQGM
ncbi:MAG TPA: HD domain-containing phosphohydrolase [Acidobacteriaceae bacterium]|jgi:putative nucleotidyltransferase with HDIG domain